MAPVPSIEVDCLIDARWVIPVEPADVILERHCVAVRDGRIVALLPSARAEREYAPHERISLPDHLLMPGLVDLHAHGGLTLLRGLAAPVDLMPGSASIIGPDALHHLSPQRVRDGMLIGCAGLLRGGVTCINEMGFFPGSAAEAALETGIRAAIGIVVTDTPTPYAADAQDYLTRGLAVRDALRGNALLSFCLSPVAPHAIGDATFADIITLAGEIDAPLHLHLNESEAAIAAHVARFGARPIERLTGLGVFGERIIAAGVSHTTESERETLARLGCSVAWCPSSDLSSASSTRRWTEMLASEAAVGLGTESGPWAHRHDLFHELRLASGMANAGDPEFSRWPPQRTLRAGTIDAARALGIDADIGSIRPGKAADLCAISLEYPGLLPCADIASIPVHGAGREDVTDVWVAGRRLVSEGRLVSVESGRLDKVRRLWQDKLRR